MAGIGNQMRSNDFAFAGMKFAGSALVIFHVAAAQNAARINIFMSKSGICAVAPSPE
jgi:hypothetical protein